MIEVLIVISLLFNGFIIAWYGKNIIKESYYASKCEYLENKNAEIMQFMIDQDFKRFKQDHIVDGVDLEDLEIPTYLRNKLMKQIKN